MLLKILSKNDSQNAQSSLFNNTQAELIRELFCELLDEKFLLCVCQSIPLILRSVKAL